MRYIVTWEEGAVGIGRPVGQVEVEADSPERAVALADCPYDTEGWERTEVEAQPENGFGPQTIWTDPSTSDTYERLVSVEVPLPEDGQE